ncbi:MAG TPA: cytochrome c maturation protein CcmE [Bacteroidia bacterium]|jgi:cytochrome c-type biogenesis protein CcmE|nr:cytochrome c maturation protein CcmE [Bacteroidia bacterium]
MKKTYIIAIIVIAIAFGVILASLSNNSTYASFKEASAHENSTFHVVGKLDRAKPFLYDPHINPNLFTFYLIDKDGTERKVTLGRPKPDDFEHSDQIVVIGKAQGTDEFAANDVLMKCPSKYNDGTPTEKKSSSL